MHAVVTPSLPGFTWCSGRWGCGAVVGGLVVFWSVGMWCSGRGVGGALVGEGVVLWSGAGEILLRLAGVGVTACRRFVPAERRETRDVYARRGRVVACPIRRSAEEHHLCPTIPPAPTVDAGVRSVSTTISRPWPNGAGGAVGYRRSRSSTRPTGCPREIAGPPGTRPKTWFPTMHAVGQHLSVFLGRHAILRHAGPSAPVSRRSREDQLGANLHQQHRPH
jgi:hypothetical protein